jgi:hypothetical protein
MNGNNEPPSDFLIAQLDVQSRSELIRMIDPLSSEHIELAQLRENQPIRCIIAPSERAFGLTSSGTGSLSVLVDTRSSRLTNLGRPLSALWSVFVKLARLISRI